MLIGHLGKDPEVKQTDGGKVFCKFSMATTETVNKKKYTEWHNITVWGKMAEVCGQYLKKGDPIFVEGKINTTIRTDGDKKQYYTGVTAFSINFLGNKNSGSAPASESNDMVDSAKGLLGAEEVEDDGIPF
jgi:single-strand DNA-binding protein